MCLAWSSLETEALALMFAKPSPFVDVTAKEEQTGKREGRKGKWVEETMVQKSVLQFSAHHSFFNEGFVLVHLWLQKIRGKYGLRWN